MERIKFARTQVAKKRWGQALDSYERILRDAGDRLSAVDLPADQIASSARVLRGRWWIHQEIASLPAEVLQLYRKRVDATAKRWLADAILSSRRSDLVRIVEEAFCSVSAETALALLGDAAFEHGDFAEALHWWQMLTALPSATGKPQPKRCEYLRYPNPKGDTARVQAKMILALLFDGDEHNARREWQAFQKHHAKANGHLAGQKGKYSAILEKWIKEGPPDFGHEQQWTTVGGNAARNREARQVPPRRLWLDGPTWTSKLPAQAIAADKTSQSIEPARRLCCHPAIMGRNSDQFRYVVVPGAVSVTLFDLLTGAQVDQYQLPEKMRQHIKTDPQTKSLRRYTVSIAHERIYALLGARIFGPVINGKQQVVQSHLVCLAWDDDKNCLKKLWSRTAKNTAADTIVFRSAPLASGSRVFLATSRIQGFQSYISLNCYNARTGEPLWQSDIAEFRDALTTTAPVVDEPALTVAGNQLICCTQAGLIAAVEARTGRRSWALRYPRRGPYTREGPPSPRELAPCVYAGGRIYTAPMDSDRLLCLDAKTGLTLWERDRVQVIHLLGCRRDKLLFTTWQGLRTVGAHSGSDQDGWQQPGQGILPPFGRGFLAGGWIFWPTVRKAKDDIVLRVVHMDHGRPQERGIAFPLVEIRKLAAGNMAYANGCLVVATHDSLIAYVAPRHLRKQRQNAAGVQVSASSLYRWARAEADAGRVNKAFSLFEKSEQLAKETDANLVSRCLRARYDLLVTEALTSGDKGDESFQKVMRGAFPRSWQLKALIARMKMNRRRGHVAEAQRMLQAIRNEPAWQWAAMWYDGQPMRGKDFVADTRKQLIQKKVNKHAPISQRPISFPLVKGWHTPAGPLLVRVPNSNAPPTRTRFFTADGTILVAHDGKTGKQLWKTPLPFRPYWLTDQTDLVVVAGPTGVAGVQLANGESTWAWTMLPIEPTASVTPFPHNGSTTATITKMKRGNDKMHVLLQLASGKTLLCNSRTGRLLFSRIQDNESFNRISVGDKGGTIGIIQETGQIVRSRKFHPNGFVNRFVWQYQPRLPSTLTGELPRLFGNTQSLLVLLPRNYGYDLERLDPNTGRNVWKPAARLCRRRVEREQIAFAERNVYYISGRTMYCRSLQDGMLRWHHTLPESPTGWRLYQNGDDIIVYHAPPPPFQWRSAPGMFSAPLPWNLQFAYPFALHVYAGQTGKLRQRLDFGWMPHGGRVQIMPDSLIVTANGVAWQVIGGEKKR